MRINKKILLERDSLTHVPAIPVQRSNQLRYQANWELIIHSQFIYVERPMSYTKLEIF